MVEQLCKHGETWVKSDELALRPECILALWTSISGLREDSALN